MLQQLRHPGIVRICPFSHGGRIYKTAWYGRGKEPPHDFYFAMEFLEGDSLAQLIRSRALRSFPLAWRVELLYQIALAIDYLHMRGVAHRDLKPENIMFRAKPQPEQVPQPVLIDFGLSEKRQLTRERDGGVNAATVAYASPEWITALRARHHQATVEIKQNPKEGLLAYDMWSFGMIAYEVLNERYTFGSPDTERTILENRIVNDQPDPMSNSVPTELASIVMKMLEQRDMNKRLTIEQFVQLLETSSGVVSPRF
jgi:serine/threonine protein kinase